jgi:hypothetical protein
MDKKESREAHKKAFLALMLRGEVISQKKHGSVFNCMRVGARMFDLRQDGHHIVTTMIYNEKTGEKWAEYSYEGVAPIQRKVKAMKGKSVADYSKAILNQPPIQTTLF